MLRRSILSVLNQSFVDRTIIVVDDNSTVENMGVISEFPNGRISYLKNSSNLGTAACRNLGFNHASSEYVAFLDDDDEFLPEKLEKQVRLADQLDEKCAVIYCGAIALDDSGKELGRAVPRIKGNIRQQIVSHGLTTISSSHLFRRSALIQIDGYDESLRGNDEHDIWMKLADADYGADFIDEAMVIAYQHSGYRKTSDPKLRVDVVDRYLNKWTPELDKWFGREGGAAYRDDYRMRVIGSLAADLITRGKWKSGFAIARDVLRQSASKTRAIYLMSLQISKASIRKFLPRHGIQVLRSMRDRVSS